MILPKIHLPKYCRQGYMNKLMDSLRLFFSLKHFEIDHLPRAFA